MSAALVTGAGKRIGRAIAERLGQAGFGVAVHYNSSAAGALETKASIEGAGGTATVIQADLSAPESAAALVADARDALGPLDLLVNSASMFQADTLETVDPASWGANLSVNALAPLMATQAFAAQAPEGAAIINLLDVQLDRPSPNFMSYSASKAALAAITRMTALSLAPRIRVNAVAPGLVLRSGAQTEETFLRRQAMTPLGEGLGPDDIAETVLFLARARQITGETVSVDSGQSLLGFGNAPLGKDFGGKGDQ